MKLKVVARKVYDYVRYDLKEIAFPSSLPDPPHIKKRRKLTWKERYLVLKEASRLYAASWVRDIGPELRPNEYKKNEDSEDKTSGVNGTTKDKEPSTLEDLGEKSLLTLLELMMFQRRKRDCFGIVNDTTLIFTWLLNGAVAARGGMETLRPVLQRVYMTRASAYRDALRSFIEGYQEGIQQVMEKKEDSSAQQEEDTPKKPT
ncbi:hypothetical protein RHSIM_Rhsim03G0069600 [Rhododendron simsii]|uniref:Embryo defective 2735 n=1 Tax=Rhododendron simsii TaxID=118357 RepID=A0A834H625_RHOSS|nr:hypothetical protein RHSIM_Rhsim03G0069600 [Rhododendron simsii]